MSDKSKTMNKLSFVKVSIHLALSTNLMVSVYGGSHLVKRDEGYYITGRGCGLSTPMKYLKEVPQNIDDHQCSFIPKKDTIAFFCDGCEKGKKSCNLGR